MITSSGEDYSRLRERNEALELALQKANKEKGELEKLAHSFIKSRFPFFRGKNVGKKILAIFQA